QEAAIPRLRTVRFRHSDRKRRRQLRPLSDANGGNQTEREHSPPGVRQITVRSVVRERPEELSPAENHGPYENGGTHPPFHPAYRRHQGSRGRSLFRRRKSEG